MVYRLCCGTHVFRSVSIFVWLLVVCVCVCVCRNAFTKGKLKVEKHQQGSTSEKYYIYMTKSPGRKKCLRWPIPGNFWRERERWAIGWGSWISPGRKQVLKRIVALTDHSSLPPALHSISRKPGQVSGMGLLLCLPAVVGWSLLGSVLRAGILLVQHQSTSCLCICLVVKQISGLPWWLSMQRNLLQCRRCNRRGFNCWLGKIP